MQEQKSDSFYEVTFTFQTYDDAASMFGCKYERSNPFHLMMELKR